MKNRYYVNTKAQPNDGHVIHQEGACRWLDEMKAEHRMYLGKFKSFRDAKREAKKRYDNARPCGYCLEGP